MVGTETLLRRLEHIEALRDSKGDWITSTNVVVRLFPPDERKKITAFVSKKHRENSKKLLDMAEKVHQDIVNLINTTPPNDKNIDYIALAMQRNDQIKIASSSIDQYIAQLNVSTAAELFRASGDTASP